MQAQEVLDRMLPYMVLGILAGFVGLIYFMGSSLALEAIVVSGGVAGGSVMGYYIYKSLGQEKSLEFAEGEEVIMSSTSPGSYAVLLSVSDQDFPFDPVKANIYFTNLGIIAEPKGSGEVGIYVPLEQVTEFSAQDNGVRIRYLDVNLHTAEVLFYVENRDLWLQTLADTLNAKPR